MALLRAFLLLIGSSYVLSEGTEYIMLELEPVQLERNIVKRQVQYAQDPRTVQYAQDPRTVQYAQDPRTVQYVQEPRAAQYTEQQTPQQITPEYYNYLQQIQAQQIQAQQLQTQQGQLVQIPGDIQQTLSSRAPQSFQQPARPQRPPTVVDEQRRLQESLAQGPLREQEREDANNQQLISLGLNPTLVRRQRLRESAQRLAAQQAEEQAARQALQTAEQQQQKHYPQHQLLQPQLVQIPQEIPVQQQAEPASETPEQVSYSQISFGSTKLPQQRVIPGRTQLIYTQPRVQAQQQALPVAYRQQVQQVQPQQVIYQPQFVYKQGQQAPQLLRAQPAARAGPLVYSPQAGRPQAISFQPQIRYVQAQPQPQPQAEVTQKQHPDQYLIETTKKEPQQQAVARKQQVSYRPQPNYEELQAALAAQQQRAHLAQQQEEASTTPASRSSIFVTTSRTPTAKAYSVPEYRIPTPEGQRPLTQNELNALINAGFSVTPSGSQQAYEQEYYRGLAKRQNVRPRIGRVPLSQEEREVLAKNGIRSLYRVQTAETQDAPVTYVLAIENKKRDTEKSTSS